MGKLSSFMSITVDGFFTDANGDVSWSHSQNKDPEWDAYVGGNASGGGALLFGRVTYEMMVKFWPTEQAAKAFPEVAEGMNKAKKFVVSRTLEKSDWNNTTVLKSDLVEGVKKLKDQSEHITILGSGSIVSQLAQAGLIDEFQMVLTPIALGNGRTMFEGLKEKLNLTLTNSRIFNNGNVVVHYEPTK